MTGKEKRGAGVSGRGPAGSGPRNLPHKLLRRGGRLDEQPLLPAPGPRPPAPGFTLLELMIVISIIVILALIVLPQYNRTVQATKEAVLRDDLHQMRRMLRQYAADKGQLPDSLDALVSAGYLSEIPEDPMTGNADWNAVFGDDPNLTEGGSGVVNVCSSSTDQALDGSTYNDCDRW